MGVVSHLPLTHSNHSMLRTLLALGVFLIPQVCLGYWPYGGYGLHPYGGHGLHPYGAGWGLGFGHPAFHGGLGYPFGMAGLYGGLLGGYGYGGYGNGKKYGGYGGGKGYGGSYGGYGGGKEYGKGSKNYGNKGYGNSRYRRSIRGTPSYHTPTSPAHHTAHTYQPMSSMVLIKPTSHLRVTSLSDSVLHISTLLVDSTHPDNVTERCTMANSRITEDIMLAIL